MPSLSSMPAFSTEGVVDSCRVSMLRAVLPTWRAVLARDYIRTYVASETFTFKSYLIQ